MFKSKRRYLIFKETSEQYKVTTSKFKILDYMTEILQDIVNNNQYIRMYYPLDDDIRNKGYLT